MVEHSLQSGGILQHFRTNFYKMKSALGYIIFGFYLVTSLVLLYKNHKAGKKLTWDIVNVIAQASMFLYFISRY